MKKGCFLTVIVTLTIIIGVGFYIIKNYSGEIINFGKDKIVKYAYDSAEEYFDRIDEDNFRDSLKDAWNRAYRNTKQMEFEDGMNYLSDIMHQMEKVTHDSFVTENEITKLKKLIDGNESN